MIFLRKQMVQDEWEEAGRQEKCVGLSVSQVHSKHDVDSVSNRHLSAPDHFMRFIIYGIHFISQIRLRQRKRNSETLVGLERLKTRGLLGKVEDMSCSVTHASPVKARTSTQQEKRGSTVGYS